MCDKSSLLQHRCDNCNSLLFKGRIVDAIIEIKCVKCGETNCFPKPFEINEKVEGNMVHVTVSAIVQNNIFPVVRL